MNNKEGKIYYGLGLDNDQLRADAIESRNIIKGIGDSSVAEGARIDNAYKKIGGAVAAIFTAEKVAEFTKSIVQVRGEIESLEISFRTLLGNKEKADSLMSQIREYAVKTPMQVGDLGKGAQTLLSFNIEAEKVMPILKQIGDISMGDKNKFQSLILAFSQMSSTGKLMGQDLLQMINAGFNPLSEISAKTGKSIGELKKEMEGGTISSQMVADAFASATAEGGKFYGMLESQSKGVNGSISNLQGAIEDMLNDMGTANQGFITGTIQGATTVVQHYKEIGEAIADIIAVYGTYKAAIIATEVVQRTISTVKHTEEAAELLKLLSAEQQAKISKLGLAKTSAEYAVAVKAEVAANVQSAQVALAKARTEVSAANQVVVARRSEYVAAKQLESQRLAELTSIGATGTAKEVEIAKRRLAAAETQKETAAISFQSATRDFNTKKTAVETAAKTANTTAASVNTAAETANATATGFLSVAKAKLAAVTSKLHAAIMSNPYALAAAAVVTLGIGIYKLVTYQTDAEKAQKKLNDTIKESDNAISSESYQIDLMFDRLKAAKQGTDEYRAAKEAIMNKYGDYLKKLGDEKTALNDVAAAYELITKKATNAAHARAMESVNNEAGEIVADKESDVYDRINKLVSKRYKGNDVLIAEYMRQLKPVIMNGAEITPQIEKIIKEFDKESGYMSGDPTRGGEWVSTTVNALQSQLDALKSVKTAAEDMVNEALKKYGAAQTDGTSNTDIFDASKASLQQLIDRLPAAKAELEALKKAEKPDPAAIASKKQEIQQINEQTLSRERGLRSIKDVKAQIEELQKEQEGFGKDDAEFKSLEARIKYLQTKLPESGKTKDQDQLEAQKDLSQKEIDLKQSTNKAVNNLMQDGLEKQKALRKESYNEEISDINKQEQAYVDALNKELGKKSNDKGYVTSLSNYVSSNPSDTGAAGYYKNLQTLKTTAEQQFTNDIEKLDQDAADNLNKIWNDVTEEFISNVDKEKRAVNEKYDAYVKEAKENGATLEYIDNLNKHRTLAINQIQSDAALKLSPLYQKAFGDIDKYGTAALESLKKSINDVIYTAKQVDLNGKTMISVEMPTDQIGEDGKQITKTVTMTIEEFQKLKDQSVKISDLIKEKNPFVALKSAFDDYKKARQNYKDALASGDSAKIESTTEALSTAQGGLLNVLTEVAKEIKEIGASVEELGEQIGGNFGDSLSKIGKYLDTFLNFSLNPIDNISKVIALFKKNSAEKDTEKLKKISEKISDICEAINKKIEKRIDLIKEATAAEADNLNTLTQEDVAQQQEYIIEQMENLKGNEMFGKKGKNNNLSLGDVMKMYGLSDIEEFIDWWNNGGYSELLAKGYTLTNKDMWQSLVDDWNDLSDAATNAKDAMQEAATGITFDDLKDSLDDLIEDVNTTFDDVGDSFKDHMEKAIMNFVKSSYLTNALQDWYNQFAEAYSDDLLTSDETESLQELYDSIYSKAKDMYAAAANAAGIDISDDEREASTEGIATASQDSVDELNGRMTAVQGHTFTISENSKILVANSNRILEHLAGIEDNTKSLSRLENMETDLQSVKATVNDIALKGIKIKN